MRPVRTTTRPTTIGYDASEEAEQTGKLDANGKLTITVPTKIDNSTRHTDQDYTIEAGVTDEANREITGRGRFLATYGSYRIHVEPDSYVGPRRRQRHLYHYRRGLRQQADPDPGSPAASPGAAMLTARRQPRTDLPPT